MNVNDRSGFDVPLKVDSLLPLNFLSSLRSPWLTKSMHDARVLYFLYPAIFIPICIISAFFFFFHLSRNSTFALNDTVSR